MGDLLTFKALIGVVLPLFISAISLTVSIIALNDKRKRDRQSDLHARELHFINVRVGLFNQLFLYPKFQHVEAFFNGLDDIHFTSSDLSDDEKQDHITRIESLRNQIRDTFISHLSYIEKELADQLGNHVKDLVDKLLKAINDDSLKLNHDAVKEEQFTKPISEARGKFYQLVYQHVPDVRSFLERIEAQNKLLR